MWCFLERSENVAPFHRYVIIWDKGAVSKHRYEIIGSKWQKKSFDARTCEYAFPFCTSQKIQECKCHHCEFCYLCRYPDWQQKVCKYRSLSLGFIAWGDQDTHGNKPKCPRSKNAWEVEVSEECTHLHYENMTAVIFSESGWAKKGNERFRRRSRFQKKKS